MEVCQLIDARGRGQEFTVHLLVSWRIHSNCMIRVVMVMNIRLLMFIVLRSMRVVTTVLCALSTSLAGTCAFRELSCASHGNQVKILLLAGAASKLVASAKVKNVLRDLLPFDLRKVGIDGLDEELILSKC